MTKEMQISMLENRLNKIKARPDAFKSPGSMRKIERKIRNLKKKLIAQPENPVVKTEIEELEILVEKMKIEREVKIC